MKRSRIVLVVFVLFALFGSAMAEDSIGINYQGRIKSKGQPFNGMGLFKFAIFTQHAGSDYILWVNDGYTTQTEPANPVSITVVDGLFSILIGDTSIPNMAALDPTIFNTGNPIFLRTWFSDGITGFELLNPDKRITNSMLIGIKQTNDITIFVNATTGNDNWSGLLPGRPKKTIQAAVNALPSVILKPAIICVAPGIYREQVLLKNIQMGKAEGSLTLIGNTSNPDSVRITGADATADSVPVRDSAILLESVFSVEIKGFLVDRCVSYAINGTKSSFAIMNCKIQNTNLDALRAANFSSLQVSDCLIKNCGSGIAVTTNSNCNITRCTIEDISLWHGVALNNCSYVGITDSTIKRTAKAGAICFAHADMSITNTIFEGCGTEHYFWSVEVWDASFCKVFNSTIKNSTVGGLRAMRGSYVQFFETSPKSLINNNPIGVRAELSSSIENTNNNSLTMTGNTIAAQIENNGKLFYIP